MMSKERQQKPGSTEKSTTRKRPPEQSRPLNPLETMPVLLQKAEAVPHHLTPIEVNRLQRSIGNQAVGRLLVQPKLTVGPVDDPYEREANAVAAHVVSQLHTDSQPMSQRQEEEEKVQMKPLLQRQGDEEEMQAKGDPGLAGGEVSEDIETAVTNAKSGGDPIAENVRQPMEQAFGADFSSVKIHTDGKSDTLNRSLSARAFTTGQDIFFRYGEYNPTTTNGKELLAHELTHTIQQGAAPAKQAIQPARTSLSDKTQETPPLQRWGFGWGKKKKPKKPKEKTNFSDFDSKQFRVSGQPPNRKIEEVKRTVTKGGQVVYYATGIVTGYKGKEPIIREYDAPISLGNWYPQVTHINGMAVAPKSGIGSAEALQDAINDAIGGENDVAMGQDAVDVLYTYSAKRGGLFADLWDCIKGKVGVRDVATKKQEEIMLDAVHRQKRTTVSAHSRGTIKTDNAVRNVHEKLAAEFLPQVRRENLEAAIDFWRINDPGIGLDPEILAEMSMQPLAKEKAKQEMNTYIQLIYAGNAVQYPSSVLKFDMYVGGLDFVSMFVGTYSEIGRNVHAHLGIGGSTDSKLHGVGKTKGHGFVKNYVPAVGEKIAEDIRNR